MDSGNAQNPEIIGAVTTTVPQDAALVAIHDVSDEAELKEVSPPSTDDQWADMNGDSSESTSTNAARSASIQRRCIGQCEVCSQQCILLEFHDEEECVIAHLQQCRHHHSPVVTTSSTTKRLYHRCHARCPTTGCGKRCVLHVWHDDPECLYPCEGSRHESNEQTVLAKPLPLERPLVSAAAQAIPGDAGAEQRQQHNKRRKQLPDIATTAYDMAKNIVKEVTGQSDEMQQPKSSDDGKEDNDDDEKIDGSPQFDDDDGESASPDNSDGTVTYSEDGAQQLTEACRDHESFQCFICGDSEMHGHHHSQRCYKCLDSLAYDNVEINHR